jgi:hypothetical protein
MKTLVCHHDTYIHGRRGREYRFRFILEDSDGRGVRIKPVGGWCKTMRAAWESAKRRTPGLPAQWPQWQWLDTPVDDK